MNWDALGAIGEVVGALAVVLTLAYLAVQIRQNTKSVRSGALDNSITTISAARQAVFESAEVSDIYHRGLQSHDNLDEVELLRFRLTMQNALWGIWNIYAQGELTGLSRGVWEAQKPFVLRILLTPGGAWFWTTYKNEFEESFATEIDRIISDSVETRE